MASSSSPSNSPSAASPRKRDTPSSQRFPAPYLFVGPPSRNASSSNIRPPPTATSPSTARDPLFRQRSTLGPNDPSSAEAGPAPDSPLNVGTAAQFPQSARRDEQTEALWAEMQNTLEEVELTASNGLNHVFGSAHARALEELRTAQVQLADAWGKGEADEEPLGWDVGAGVSEGAKEEGLGLGLPEGVKEGERGALGGRPGVLAAEMGEKLGMESVGSSGGERGKVREGGRERAGSGAGGHNDKTQLEEDTDTDILLARKRREANDRYFERVSKGVVDVVAKLDEVAKRMREVELESRELWGERDSLDSESLQSSARSP